MTMILTHIDRHGIVHASDSNLTVGTAESGEGQKTFEIPHLSAGLTLAGAYSVGSVPMDKWMTGFIQNEGGLCSTLEEFARALACSLESQMLKPQKSSGSMMHLAGYVSDKHGVSHPEFWFVRNVSGINPITGGYEGLQNTFAVSEDFWSRDCPQGRLLERFPEGAYQLYINGTPPGRISYVALTPTLNEFFARIWQHPDWEFRPPHDISETELLVKLYASVIGVLFELSDYPARYVGGPIQTYAIPAPKVLAKHC